MTRQLWIITDDLRPFYDTHFRTKDESPEAA